MTKRYSLFIGFIVLFSISLGCSGPSRLETDFGTSLNLMKVNQIANPEAEKNIEAVSGLDGEAAQRTMEKYRKDFEKPASQMPFTLNIGTSGNK